MECYGETALHWAALLGEDRLADKLIPGSDLNLETKNTIPHRWDGRSTVATALLPETRGGNAEVAALLVKAGATVESAWLEFEEVRADASILAALGMTAC